MSRYVFGCLELFNTNIGISLLIIKHHRKTYFSLVHQNCNYFMLLLAGSACYITMRSVKLGKVVQSIFAYIKIAALCFIVGGGMVRLYQGR